MYERLSVFCWNEWNTRYRLLGIRLLKLLYQKHPVIQWHWRVQMKAVRIDL